MTARPGMKEVRDQLDERVLAIVRRKTEERPRLGAYSTEVRDLLGSKRTSMSRLQASLQRLEKKELLVSELARGLRYYRVK